jgi:hypothetical protein
LRKLYSNQAIRLGTLKARRLKVKSVRSFLFKASRSEVTRGTVVISLSVRYG